MAGDRIVLTEGSPNEQAEVDDIMSFGIDGVFTLSGSKWQAAKGSQPT